MAMTVDIHSQVPAILDDDIKCGVCLDVYKDPQLLSCLHTFCKSCLKVSAETNKIACPVCRKEDDASDLLPNSMLADKVKASGAEADDTTSSLCGQCMSLLVVIFCRECDDYLCQQCKEAHEKMAIFKGHRSHVVSIDQAKTLPKLKRYKCPEHKEMTLNAYCLKCQIVICKDCALYKHQGHTFKPAEEAAPEVKEKLISSITTLKKQQEEFQEHSQTIAQAEKHVTTYPDELKFFITREFDKLMQELEARKQHLLKTVDAKYDSFSKTLWAEKNTIDITLSHIEAGIKIAQQICESQKYLELAVLGAQACKSLEKISAAVDWDPAVVKSLGPLVYLRKDDNTSDQSIMQTETPLFNSIGGLVNLQSLRLTLIPHKYGDFSSFILGNKKEFIEGGTVIVKVNKHLTQAAEVEDILFPKLISNVTRVDVSTQKEVPHTFNGQDITFTTTNPGDYTITVSNGTTVINSLILHFTINKYMYMFKK